MSLWSSCPTLTWSSLPTLTAAIHDSVVSDQEPPSQGQEMPPEGQKIASRSGASAGTAGCRAWSTPQLCHVCCNSKKWKNILLGEGAQLPSPSGVSICCCWHRFKVGTANAGLPEGGGNEHKGVLPREHP